MRYLVRIRLIAFQDWNPPSPALPGGHWGGRSDEDDDDGSPDSNINRYHPGIDVGPPRHSPTDPSPSGGSGSGGSANRYPGFGCGAVVLPPEDRAVGAGVASQVRSQSSGPVRSLVVGTIPCPVVAASSLGAGLGQDRRGNPRLVSPCEIPDVTSERAPATPAASAKAEDCAATFSDRWMPEAGQWDIAAELGCRTPVAAQEPSNHRLDPMEFEANMEAPIPGPIGMGERDLLSPDLGPLRLAQDEEYASLKVLFP